MIPLQPSVRTHSASRGLQGAPGSKAPDRQQQPLLLIFLPSSRLGSSPKFRRTVQSSNVLSHRASSERQLAQSDQSKGETDTKSEPQNRESGQCVVGLSGTGKTHIALGLGLAACQRGLKVRFTTAAALVHDLIEAQDERRLQRLQKLLTSQNLLIIDELGFVPLSKSGAELLFEVISQCYERGSIIITSNLPFDEWTEVFGSERLTGALLDRLTHHVHILEMNGESYRLKHSRNKNQ